MKRDAGKAAVAQKGWWLSYRYLMLRRLTQLSVIGLFLLGPLTGVWIIKGNLSGSLLLDLLPISDPYVLSQSIASGFWPALDALLGALLILAIYGVIGGRMFCGWICPLNIVTDSALWLRRKLRIRSQFKPNQNLRYWLLAASLLVPAITGYVAWELINPVSMLFRGMIFGLGSGLGLIIGIFMLDLLLIERGWCGHLCPMGAFYGVLGTKSVMRVSAEKRHLCDDCMDCYSVCPEPQILRQPLKGAAKGLPPLIDSGACSNCLRCIEVCPEQVFTLTHRFANQQAENSK